MGFIINRFSIIYRLFLYSPVFVNIEPNRFGARFFSHENNYILLRLRPKMN